MRAGFKGSSTKQPALDPRPWPRTARDPSALVEGALAGLGIKPDHREQVGRRHVPARREVGRRSVWRDREDELDLAYVRSEADTATHRAEDRIAGAQAQVSWCVPPCERLENTIAPQGSIGGAVVLHLPRERSLERRAAGRGVRGSRSVSTAASSGCHGAYSSGYCRSGRPPSAASRRTTFSGRGLRASPS